MNINGADTIKSYTKSTQLAHFLYSNSVFDIKSPKSPDRDRVYSWFESRHKRKKSIKSNLTKTVKIEIMSREGQNGKFCELRGNPETILIQLSDKGKKRKYHKM